MVEDNPADVMLMHEGLRFSPYSYDIEVIPDGEQAVRRVRACSGGVAPMPDLIILDLNLPKITGHDVLREIRRCEATSLVPVIIMSGSNSPSDIDRAYELHANCYVRKPGSLDELFHVVQTMERVWLKRVALPNASLIAAGGI